MKLTKRTKLIIILTVVMLFICLAGILFTNGFGFSDDIEEESGREDLIVVGVSQIGSESVWRTANSNSVQEALTKDNGFFLIFENARQKQENQIKAIRNFISQQVDYIVFSPITETGWDTVLMEAKEAGIPVIMMDRQASLSDESLYTSWVGSNFEQEGKMAGEWLETYLREHDREREELRIVVLQGTAGATSVIGRTEGFEQVASRHGNWTILEQKDAEYTTAMGREVMKNFLIKYPDIDVVVSQNDDMTFGAMEAIEEAEKTTGTEGDIILISFDAVKSALALVQEGKINVDIECNPLQGQYIMDIIRSLEAGEQVEKARYIDENIFTPDNVAEYIDERTY